MKTLSALALHSSKLPPSRNEGRRPAEPAQPPQTSPDNLSTAGDDRQRSWREARRSPFHLLLWPPVPPVPFQLAGKPEKSLAEFTRTTPAPTIGVHPSRLLDLTATITAPKCKDAVQALDLFLELPKSHRFFCGTHSKRSIPRPEVLALSRSLVISSPHPMSDLIC